MLVKNTTINITYKMFYINAKKLTSKIFEKQLIKHKTNDMICCRMQKNRIEYLQGRIQDPWGLLAFLRLVVFAQADLVLDRHSTKESVISICMIKN